MNRRIGSVVTVLVGMTFVFTGFAKDPERASERRRAEREADRQSATAKSKEAAASAAADEASAPLSRETRERVLRLLVERIKQPGVGGKIDLVVLQATLEGRQDAFNASKIPPADLNRFKKTWDEFLKGIVKKVDTTPEDREAARATIKWIEDGLAPLPLLTKKDNPADSKPKKLTITKNPEPNQGTPPAGKDMAKGGPKPAEPEKKRAIGGKINWRSSLSVALADAANSGKPLLLFFFAEKSPFSQKLEDETFVDAEVADLVNKSFVAAKADAEKNDAATKDYEIKSPPTIAIVRYGKKSTKEVIERLPGFRDAPTFVGDLKKVLTKIGSLQPIEGPEQYQRRLELAEKEMGNGKYGLAYQQAKKLADMEENLVEVKAAKDMIAKIESMARERLEELRGVVAEKNYIKGATLLKKLQSDFESTPFVDQARDIEEQLKDNPEARVAVRKASAQNLYDLAKEDMKNNRLSLALSRFESIVADYGDLPLARHVKWQLGQIHADSRMMRKIRDEEAASQAKVWLSLARTWKKNQKFAQANQYYDKIIQTFPGTTFAQTAEREIHRE